MKRPGLALPAALMLTLPLIGLAGWTASVSCYKPNGSYQGYAQASLTTDLTEIEGDVYLEHLFYNGSASAMFYRTGKNGTPSDWLFDTASNVNSVGAGFGWSHQGNFSRVETRCHLMDADAEVDATN